MSLFTFLGLEMLKTFISIKQKTRPSSYLTYRLNPLFQDTAFPHLLNFCHHM